MRRENLSVDEAADAMRAIMSGEATPAQIAALLVGLTMKGERPAEIVGLAKTMRANAVQLTRTFDDVFDTCGTGGDRSGTFNISSAAALVAAAAGLRVAKHGNRSVSSQCGSADVYEALGVNIAAAPAVVEESLEKMGIAFFFAPTFHPSMRHAAPVRRELAVRTAFNLLGPLTNPAGTRRQLVGVPHSELTELLARALAAARLAARVGRSWRRRHRRDVDDGSYKGLGVPGRRRLDVLRPPVGLRPADGEPGGPARRRCGDQRGDPARDPRGRERPATRRRPAECRCVAVHRREGSLGARRHRSGRAGDRFGAATATLDAMIAASKASRCRRDVNRSVAGPSRGHRRGRAADAWKPARPGFPSRKWNGAQPQSSRDPALFSARSNNRAAST